MYNKVATDMNFVSREKAIAEMWKKNDIVRKSFHHRDGSERFTFFDGPPTANGKPHIGHVETRAIKDLIPRYQTMKGKSVLRKAGWDTHGLPVELEVEKALGLDGKPQIEQYGIEPFIAECKKSVWKYLHEWEKMSDQVAYWVDMEHPYVTYENDYIESEWWSLKQIFEKGLLYQGHKIVPYCPRCGRSGPGLQEREGDFRLRPLPGKGRGEHLPAGLDHHALDAAEQPGAVREPPGHLLQVHCAGRKEIHHGQGPDRQGLRRTGTGL